MRILFLSRWFPYPPDNGSKIRIFNLVKHLSSRHEIVLISFTADPVDNERLAAMQHYCQRVEVVPYLPFRPTRLKALLGFFAQQPRSVIDTYSRDMQTRVAQVTSEWAFDAVIASQIDMTSYALAVLSACRIFEEVELTTLYEQFVKQRHPLKKLRNGLTWWKLSGYMRNLLQHFAACTVVSAQEQARIRQVAPGYRSIGIVPNGVDVSYYAAGAGSPEADTLLYSGALTYGANFDAVDFFLREIFPLIQVEQPGARLFVTGKLEGVPMERLPQNDRVVFTGYLDDIRPTLARSWITVVPLREGGGTRLKILESLAAGTPVVATTKGAEGLDLIPGRDILIADTPADFAAAVIHLLRDPILRQTLSRNGRQAVAASYDWQIVGQQFNDLIEAAVARTEPVSVAG